MIEFMLLSAPRCATTWASNWLTTDKTLCLHDPLWTKHYSELDSIQSTRRVGLACTGLFKFPEFVNAHPAKKVILHRPLVEINRSLQRIGMPEMSQKAIDELWAIDGKHVAWTALFDHPATIYEHLTGMEFDKERYDLLREMEIQPYFAELRVGPDVTKRLLGELR